MTRAKDARGTGVGKRLLPSHRKRFYTDRDVEEYVFEPLLAVVGILAKARLLNRYAGRLLIRWLHIGYELPFDIGEDWEHPFDEVATAKRLLDNDVMPWALPGPSGPLSRYAQTMGTTLLTGTDVVHFGSYVEDGIAIEFSGVQAQGDEGICRMAFALLKILTDLRKVMLDQVRTALGLRYYYEAMDVIEKVAADYGYGTIDEAVARIVDDATLRRTKQIIQQRALAGEAGAAMRMAGLATSGEGVGGN